MKVNHQEKKLLAAANIISKRNNVSNPIESSDSILYFKQIVVGTKQEVLVSDSLAILWQDYKENQFKIELYNKQLEIRKAALQTAKDEYKITEETNKWIFWTGIPFVILGFIGMVKQQDIQDDLLKRQLQEKGKLFVYCQSCGKKFSPIRPKGKNKDGTINEAFCSNCYQEGEFVEKDLTADEFIKRAKAEIAKRKTWLGRKLLSGRLKHLERWNTDEYF